MTTITLYLLIGYFGTANIAVLERFHTQEACITARDKLKSFQTNISCVKIDDIAVVK